MIPPGCARYSMATVPHSRGGRGSAPQKTSPGHTVSGWWVLGHNQARLVFSFVLFCLFLSLHSPRPSPGPSRTRSPAPRLPPLPEIDFLCPQNKKRWALMCKCP